MAEPELIFLVTPAEEGGWNARAVNLSIFTRADDLDELERNALEAVEVYFDEPQERPRRVRFAFQDE